MKIAVLLTCYNRKSKTISCLSSFYNCEYPIGYSFDIYLVDDGSTDGTLKAVIEKFPNVKIIIGSGSLFWAGGMRLAWQDATTKCYDAYLLLNDDVKLVENFFENIIYTHKYCLDNFNKGGIYVSSTVNENSGVITYGGSLIKNGIFRNTIQLITPADKPINCKVANANILFVCANVVNKIGIFDEKFIHGIADYDYTLTAYENDLPLLICPGIGGNCDNDHSSKYWLSTDSTIKERIDFLYNPKGLAYNEYMYYIRKHFPFSLPYVFLTLWSKTLFPIIWEKFKKLS